MIPAGLTDQPTSPLGKSVKREGGTSSKAPSFLARMFSLTWDDHTAYVRHQQRKGR